MFVRNTACLSMTYLFVSWTPAITDLLQFAIQIIDITDFQQRQLMSELLNSPVNTQDGQLKTTVVNILDQMVPLC